MTTVKHITKIEKIPVVTWTIKDIIVVVSCIIFGSALFYFLLLFLFGDSKITFRLVIYVGAIFGIFLPLFWIRKRYGLTKESLGLKKGELYLSVSVVIGIVTGLSYSLLIKIFLFNSTSIINADIPNFYLSLILLPISISGFPTIVLAPVSEEILFRGFMYGYFRKKMGIIYGLLFQALLFSLLHFSPMYKNTFYLIISDFLVGLILGTLYEKSGSIYPSIICHGTINYLAIIFKFIKI